ncbi:MAG: diphthamide synthesis protein [Candidatus Woesearchaeota archaeon]
MTENMKRDTSIIFIPAKYSKKILVPSAVIEQLPEKIMVFSSIQFLENLAGIIKQLESKGKKPLIVQSRNFLYDGMISEKGQLLGCNLEFFDTKKYEDSPLFDAFMYIGDGVFHPQALMMNNRKDVYCYDPKTKKLNILKKEIHDQIQKRVKGSILKFLTSHNIGIIISNKRGQNNNKRADTLKENILRKWPDRNVYMLVCDELNFQELENFNFIEIYINSACPRIGHDDTIRSNTPIINIGDAENVLQN